MVEPIKESEYMIIRKTEDCICMVCGGYGAGIEFESKIEKATIEICDNCLRNLARSHLGVSLQKTEFTREEFMIAYDEGKSDMEIARMLGVNVLTVKRYRSLYRLPPKGQRLGLSHAEKKELILKLFRQKGVLILNDLPKGFRGAFTRLLYDPDVDVATFRFAHRGTGRTVRSAYQLFQDDIVGKTVYFLTGDHRIIDFIASKIKKPVTQSNAKVLTQHLRNYGFSLEEAHSILTKAEYEYHKL